MGRWVFKASTFQSFQLHSELKCSSGTALALSATATAQLILTSKECGYVYVSVCKQCG